MRVLHILNELKYSGAEIMYVAAAEKFIDLGCELYVVNSTENLGEYSSQFELAGFKVLHWPHSFKISSFKKVINYLKNNNFDVVHIHSFDKLLFYSFCAWLTNKKIVYTIHNVIKSNWYSYVYHLLIRKVCQKIFKTVFQSISDSVYDHELSYYNTNSIKIYNWYDNKRFYPAAKDEKNKLRNKLGLNSEAMIIISIGGCSHIKRHTDIIKALPLVVKENSNTFYLHLGEGSILDEEIKLAKELNVENNILFLGNINNVRDYLIASDIYLMPSRFEGIPITAIEALACKIPSILYNVPGLRDFNNKQVCVVLIEENYKLLANNIIQLYNNKVQQNVIVENGNNLVNKYFYLDLNVIEIFKLYK